MIINVNNSGRINKSLLPATGLIMSEDGSFVNQTYESIPQYVISGQTYFGKQATKTFWGSKDQILEHLNLYCFLKQDIHEYYTPPSDTSKISCSMSIQNISNIGNKGVCYLSGYGFPELGMIFNVSPLSTTNTQIILTNIQGSFDTRNNKFVGTACYSKHN